MEELNREDTHDDDNHVAGEGGEKRPIGPNVGYHDNGKRRRPTRMRLGTGR